jgi:hypothetical protein
MANFNVFNVKDEEVWSHINLIIKRNKQFYVKIRIRCVAFKSDNTDEYQNVLCIITAFDNKTMPQGSQDKICEYKNICLFENWYSMDDFKLNNWINEERDRFILRFSRIHNFNPHGDIGIKLDNSLTFSHYSFEPFDNDYSELSGYLYKSNNRLSTTINTYNFTDAILSYEKPIFLDTFQAIKEWFELKEFYNDSDARLGSVVMFLPEGMSGFKSINSLDGKLKISTRLADEKLKENLKVKILWIIDGQTKNSEYEFDKEISCDIPIDAESVFICLIGSDETVYDYYQETTYWAYKERRIIGVVNNSNNDLQEIVLGALKNGENETTEFKPFIVHGDKKWDEIIKTVIAFSNTHGGNIIIGINDNVYIEDIESLLNIEYHKHKKSEPKLENKPVEWYEGLIKKKIGDKLSGDMRPIVDHLSYDGHTLIIIKVQEGKEKPYFNRETKDIYIRKGSSNAKPDPSSELPDLLKEKLMIQNNISNLGYKGDV